MEVKIYAKGHVEAHIALGISQDRAKEIKIICKEAHEEVNETSLSDTINMSDVIEVAVKKCDNIEEVVFVTMVVQQGFLQMAGMDLSK